MNTAKIESSVTTIVNMILEVSECFATDEELDQLKADITQVLTAYKAERDIAVSYRKLSELDDAWTDRLFYWCCDEFDANDEGLKKFLDSLVD